MNPTIYYVVGAILAIVRKFHIEELPAGAKDRYTEEWRTVQTRFVDEPRTAVVDADHLVVAVMRDRGYPMENFEQRARRGLNRRSAPGDAALSHAF
jgi:hypothetical protein